MTLIDLANPTRFLSLTARLMPFALGPDLALLARLGPAILWLGALLASLLTLDRLFMADHEDGSLDLIVMGLDFDQLSRSAFMLIACDGCDH